MVREQKMEAAQRRELEVMQKRQQQRQELIRKIIAENELRLKIEAEVSKLEQDEFELIQRLQNTSNLQKQAYEDLEGALNGDVNRPRQWAATKKHPDTDTL